MLKVNADECRILETSKFYHDNDLKTKSRLIQQWLLYNRSKVFCLLPQSPGMNPIKNELECRLRKHLYLFRPKSEN